MKVLVLVVSGGSEAVYAEHKVVWRLNTHPQITRVFIEYSPDVSTFTLQEDTLYLPGVESYHGMTRKTLDSIQYFLQDESFTHVIRTNLSSVWHFPRLLDELEKLPNTNLYTGIVGKCDDTLFVSGAGIYLSRDVCLRLLDAYEVTCARPDQDDVAIAITLQSIGVPIRGMNARLDILSPDSMGLVQEQSAYHHFRFKQTSDRSIEPSLMKRVLDSFKTHIETSKPVDTNAKGGGHYWCNRTGRFVSR